MPRSIAFAALFVSNFALALRPSNAIADEPVTTTPAASAPAASPYAVALREGYTKLREGDAAAAQLAFQRATMADATKSEGHYLLGVAMLRNGSREPAVASFRAALERAVAATDRLGEARARVAIAHALSTIAREHHATAHSARDTSTANARQAWDELVAFATAHPEILAPEIPRAEMAAEERVRELATRVEPVRARIAAREREAATHPSARSGH